MHFIVVLEDGETWEEINEENGTPKVMILTDEQMEDIVNGESYPGDIEDECSSINISDLLTKAVQQVLVEKGIERLRKEEDPTH